MLKIRQFSVYVSANWHTFEHAPVQRVRVTSAYLRFSFRSRAIKSARIRARARAHFSLHHKDAHVVSCNWAPAFEPRAA